MTSYSPTEVETKWQKKWADAKAFEIDLSTAKKPYFTHTMYPYPSGDKLHIGHWFNYGPADSFARYQKMQGYDVFSPIGFDAFGLPAENYAIKTGVHPRESITENVNTMISQLKRIGCMYDWNKMVISSHPEYYQWTQWLFLQMFKNDLAYRKEATVNYCDSCKTVLANEQVHDGHCDRCDSLVIQKPLTQWFWNITKYSQQLLDNLDDLDWPEKTKAMQRNWIGRKEGINITYEVDGVDESITCFTTRPDTNFGATFLVVAPDHPFANKVANGELPSDHAADVKKYAEEAAVKIDIDRIAEGRKKTGAFTGYYVTNKLNDAKIPVWVGDFVLSTFGTGAVVGVPGHDLRDFEFAQEFDIPITRVVVSADGDTSEITKPEQVQESQGTMINSQFLDGMPIMEAVEAMKDHLETEGWGKRIVTYRLRDWLISRQRYWGAPIPIVYDPDGKPHPIPEEHLPWTLPEDVDFTPDGTAPLARSEALKKRTEEIFGEGWTPEVDTMDTFVCSSFYTLMYLASDWSSGDYKQPPVSAGKIVDKDVEKKWLPVQMYIGGAEHACMHLIYCRFVSMVLKDLGHISHDEQYQRLVHQGIITNEGAKMSKSKGNVVSPDPFVEKYGSDVFRMYLMFMGPYTDGGDWGEGGIKGIDRFVQRVWRLVANADRSGDDAKAVSKLHATIKKVGTDIERLHFNTALSALMELLNELEKAKTVSEDTMITLTKLLSPLAPHLAEELWETLGQDGFVMNQAWPEYDEAHLVADTLTIAVQVNGKVRGEIEIATGTPEAEVIAAAKAEEVVAKYLENGTKKEIYIEGKLVSLVV